MLNGNPVSNGALGKSDISLGGHGGLSVKIVSMFIFFRIHKERKNRQREKESKFYSSVNLNEGTELTKIAPSLLIRNRTDSKAIIDHSKVTGSSRAVWALGSFLSKASIPVSKRSRSKTHLAHAPDFPLPLPPPLPDASIGYS